MCSLVQCHRIMRAAAAKQSAINDSIYSLANPKNDMIVGGRVIVNQNSELTVEQLKNPMQFDF